MSEISITDLVSNNFFLQAWTDSTGIEFNVSTQKLLFLSPFYQ